MNMSSVRRRYLALCSCAAAATVPAFIATGQQTAAATTFPSPIRHVVIIYQENHSFDNVFGVWCQTHTSRCTPPPSSVTLPDGVTVTLTESGDVVPQVSHTTADQAAALRGDWDQVGDCTAANGYPCLTLTNPANEPNLMSLANTYGLSDATYSTASVPSWGAHYEVLTGGLFGFDGNNPVKGTIPKGDGWGCDSNKDVTWKGQKVPACDPDYTLGLANGGAYRPTPVPHQGTFFDSCDAAHRTCRVYGAPDPGTPDKLYSDGYIWNVCAYAARTLYGPQQTDCKHTSQFIPVAQAGKLPNLSWVFPDQGPAGMTSQHNGDSMIAGDNYLAQALNAVMTGPEWSSTAVFIAYDDCGCFYDHVTPPAGLGIRAPVVLVSPYAKSAYTDHATASQPASLQAAANWLLGLNGLGRTRTAYNYSGMFDFSQQPLSRIALHRTPVPPGEALSPDLGDGT